MSKYYCLAVALLLICSAPGAVSAATYYVGKSGSDANSCATAQSATAGNRKLTIASGISCLSSGDTLVIGDGTYLENIDDSLPSGGGTWETATILKGETICAPKTASCGFILQPTSSATIGMQFTGDDTSWIKVQYVTIDMVNATGGESEHCLKTTGVSGFPNHIWADAFECKNGSGAGVQWLNGAVASGVQSWGHIASNCSVHNNGSTDNNQGFYWVARNSVVQDCDIYSQAGPGLSIYVSNLGNPADNIVERSTIHNNGTIGNGAGIIFAGTPRPIIRNNLIYANPSDGIQALSGTGDVDDAKIFNNTITGNGGKAVNITDANSSGDAVTNNIVYGNTGGDISLSGTGHTQTTNLTTDPSFTNAAGADFTLQSGSAARDTGTNLSGDGVTTDYLGTSRPQNGVFDIGAYEYLVASRAAGVSGVVRPSGTVRMQ